MDKIDVKPLPAAQLEGSIDPNPVEFSGGWSDLYEPERKRLSTRWVVALVLLFSLLDGLIWLRVILKLMAANPANSFVHFIYQASSPLTWPFANLVENPTGGGMVVEITSIIGIITYSLVCWSILQWNRIRREARHPEEIDW